MWYIEIAKCESIICC